MFAALGGKIYALWLQNAHYALINGFCRIDVRTLAYSLSHDLAGTASYGEDISLFQLCGLHQLLAGL